MLLRGPTWLERATMVNHIRLDASSLPTDNAVANELEMKEIVRSIRCLKWWVSMWSDWAAE